MDLFSAEADFIIWLATNPQGRKFSQIKNNSNFLLPNVDKNENGYIFIYGIAVLVMGSNFGDIKNDGFLDFYIYHRNINQSTCQQSFVIAEKYSYIEFAKPSTHEARNNSRINHQKN